MNTKCNSFLACVLTTDTEVGLISLMQAHLFKFWFVSPLNSCPFQYHW